MQDFFDIDFFLWNNVPKCHAWVNKHFDYYVLDFVETGFLEFKYGNEPFIRLEAPVAWLTFPGPRFQFGNRMQSKESWHHRYVAFRGGFADKLVQRGLFPITSPVIPIYNPDRFAATFDKLFNYLDNPLMGNDRAANIFIDLLLQLHEQKIELQFMQMDGRIKSLIKKIKESPAENWNFRKEAAKINLSFSRFRKIFTDSLKQTPCAFLIAERLSMAARLLKETEMSIAEIAEACNYEDIYYFNKSFKKYYAIPPGKYRKQFNLC